MAQTFHDFKLLKQSVSIHQVLADRGLAEKLRRRGDRLVGPCPVHDGDNPNAFVVSLSRNLWYCFSRCGQGGDVIELVRQLDNATYQQAAAYLASLADTPVLLPPSSQPANPTKAPQRKPFRPFAKPLNLDPRASLLISKGIKPATAALFQAGAYHGPGFLHRCIGVRLHDPSGHPLGYAGRRLQANANRCGKWKLPPGLPKSSILYGFHRVANRLDTGLCVVECPWGVMRLHQLAIPAVALLGTSLSPQQRRLLARVPHIVLLLDGDPAGRSAARRINNTLCRTNDVRVVSLPDGSDPDDLDDTHLAALVRPALKP